MSTRVDLKPATFKHIEAELYGYPDTKKEIQKRRQELMTTSEPDENVGAGKNSYRTPGRPTEQIATRLTTDRKLRNLEEIVEAIESVYDQASNDHRAIIETGYWNRRGRTWEEVANACHMHRNTARKYRHEIIALVAEKVGWQ